MNPLLPVALFGGGLIAVAKLLDGSDRPSPRTVFDVSSALGRYYNRHVRLSRKQQNKLAAHRDATRTRLEQALMERGFSRPAFVPQGSYAMDTINQEDDEDYDLDDGIIFKAEELVGPRGGKLSRLQARQLVAECADDPRLGAEPEVRTNCVRIYYAAGYHVDVAVYREIRRWTGRVEFEHAGAEWATSDPAGVTRWFNTAVHEKSPDDANGRQMRRVVRLIKYLGKSRRSWNFPSGFAISVLVNEAYEGVPERDDVALYLCLAKIYNRLKWNLAVSNPVTGVGIVRRSQMTNCRDKLEYLLGLLEGLLEPTCDEDDALAIWADVFNDERIE